MATSLSNLATLYDAQGRYAEAVPMYKRALAICGKALGPDHPDVTQSLNNLAGVYEVHGRLRAFNLDEGLRVQRCWEQL